MNKKTRIAKAQELMTFVRNQIKDGKKYILYSPWGHELQLAEDTSVGGTFLMTTPIMRFKPDMTQENLEFIKQELHKYFE